MGTTLLLNAVTLGGYSTYQVGVSMWQGYQEIGLLGAVNALNPLYAIARGALETYQAAESGDYRAAGSHGAVTAVIAATTASGIVGGLRSLAGKPLTGTGAGSATNEAAENAVRGVDYSHIGDPKNVSASPKPTPRQVREMKAANRAHNGGELKSDLSGKPMLDSGKSQRGIVPPANEAQVDHIVPIDKGGTRTQSNLRLITREENRAKWNK
ncbi:MAG: HNH endonuclease [Polyangiaceae bacterium]|nr:HNH endonuclease [Polyangiaceae bacterium]